VAGPRVMNLIGTSAHPSVQVSASLPTEFLISLVTFGSPESQETFEVGSAWFNEVRTKASPRLLELLDLDHRGGWQWGTLVGLALKEPAAEDVSTFIARVEDQSPPDVWLTLADYHILEVRDAVGEETYLKAVEGDGPARQSILRSLSKFEEDAERFLPHLTQAPSHTKEVVLEILRRWHEEIFVEGESERAAVLAKDAETKRALALTVSAESLIEAATNGLEYPREPLIRRVVLVPHISMRPWNIMTAYEDTSFICYPVADESLGVDRSAPPAGLLRLHKALSDEKRLRMLRLLAGGPATLQQLAEGVGLAKSSAHHHLVILRTAGLVKVTLERESLYTLRRESLDESSRLLGSYLEGRPS
jgi:DNA-binding transcriptional ArsR family regulator